MCVHIQDYCSLIPLLALTLFKQHFIFLWESLHPSICSPSIFLSFLPSISRSHPLSTQDGGRDGKLQREREREEERYRERDDPVFFNLLLIPSSIHLASKLNNNTSITYTHIRHTHTRRTRRAVPSHLLL